jgi:hypothetical protein
MRRVDVMRKILEDGKDVGYRDGRLTVQLQGRHGKGSRSAESSWAYHQEEGGLD